MRPPFFAPLLSLPRPTKGKSHALNNPKGGQLGNTKYLQADAELRAIAAVIDRSPTLLRLRRVVAEMIKDRSGVSLNDAYNDVDAAAVLVALPELRRQADPTHSIRNVWERQQSALKRDTQRFESTTAQDEEGVVEREFADTQVSARDRLGRRAEDNILLSYGFTPQMLSVFRAGGKETDASIAKQLGVQTSDVTLLRSAFSLARSLAERDVLLDARTAEHLLQRATS